MNRITPRLHLFVWEEALKVASTLLYMNSVAAAAVLRVWIHFVPGIP